MFTCESTDVEQIALYEPAPGVMPYFFLENDRLSDEELARIDAWIREHDGILFAGSQRPPLAPEEPTDPEEPGEPEDPSGPADPDVPTDPEGPADPGKPGAGQQGGADADKRPGGGASGIPKTGDASEGAALATAALGTLGAGAAVAGGVDLAALRRRA